MPEAAASVTLGANSATPPQRVAPVRLASLGGRRRISLLLFVVASLAVSMSVGQEDEIEPGSLAYWLLILPAALMPLAQVGALVRNLLGPAKMLAAMLVVGGGWQLATGDARAAVQLTLLVWVLAWVGSRGSALGADDLVKVFLAFVLAGVAVDQFTELNPWGLLPGRTADEYGIWRVSFFPNIANTGMLSLAVLLWLTRDAATLQRHPMAFALALYFLVFSFVRTALIGAAVYLALRWWFARAARPRAMAWTAGIVAVGLNLMIASSVIALALAQDYQLLSRLLLRGESGLSAEEIFQQLYRPWLWGQHLLLFADSPALMGHGSFEFATLQSDELIEGHPGIGSDALPTRLLAAYGLAGGLFTMYLFACLRALAKAQDRWACAAFPTVVLLMMNWGSIFHPSNAFFVLFFLAVTRGSRGLTDGR